MHLAKRTQLRLDEIRTEIFDAADSFVDRVGGLLVEAKALHPRGFVKWVEAELPFSYDTARRLMAVHVAYKHLPPERRAQLPRPWQALFAIRDHIPAALASPAIGPGTTVREAVAFARQQSGVAPSHTMCDIVAARLMLCDRGDLGDAVAEQLQLWLTEGVAGVVAPVEPGVGAPFLAAGA